MSYRCLNHMFRCIRCFIIGTKIFQLASSATRRLCTTLIARTSGARRRRKDGQSHLDLCYNTSVCGVNGMCSSSISSINNASLPWMIFVILGHVIFALLATFPCTPTIAPRTAAIFPVSVVATGVQERSLEFFERNSHLVRVLLWWA